MRTRRSPRNQEILWRALGGPQAPKPVPTVAPRLTVEEIEAKLSGFLKPRDRGEMNRALVVAKQRERVRIILEAERGES